mgnify:CR=1 FL=1|jgi:hypothetical protein|nr:MAG TPA: hypothetical protein [Caudoviricetes sp.]
MRERVEMAINATVSVLSLAMFVWILASICEVDTRNGVDDEAEYSPMNAIVIFSEILEE